MFIALALLASCEPEFWNHAGRRDAGGTEREGSASDFGEGKYGGDARECTTTHAVVFRAAMERHAEAPSADTDRHLAERRDRPPPNLTQVDD